MPCGLRKKSQDISYVETNYQNTLISDILQSLTVSDVCLVGPRGCGKSITVHKLAEILGYDVEPIVLYQVICIMLIQNSVFHVQTTKFYLKNNWFLGYDITRFDTAKKYFAQRWHSMEKFAISNCSFRRKACSSGWDSSSSFQYFGCDI